MSSITRCAITGRPLKVLPLRTLLKVLAIFLAIQLFGLAHLCLRFSINSYQVEINHLQSLQGTLQSEVKVLQSRTQSLKRPDSLIDYARTELGMVRYEPTERETLRMPREIFSRYEVARASRADGPLGEPGDKPLWIDKLSERFGLISQALAGEIKKN